MLPCVKKQLLYGSDNLRLGPVGALELRSTVSTENILNVCSFLMFDIKFMFYGPLITTFDPSMHHYDGKNRFFWNKNAKADCNEFSFT